MKELEYPFDNGFIMKKKRSLKRQLLGDGAVRLKKRVAVLGGSTTDDIVSVLELFLLDMGFECEFYQSEYGQFWQDAVFSNEELDRFKPDIVYIHTSLRNLSFSPTPRSGEEEIEQGLNAELDRLSQAWDGVKEHFGCPVIQNNFELPFFRLMGNMDASDRRGKVNFVTRLNSALYDRISQRPEVYLNDINWLSAAYGLEKWSEPKYWYLYKYALNIEAIPELAFQVANIIKAMTLDFDLVQVYVKAICFTLLIPVVFAIINRSLMTSVSFATCFIAMASGYTFSISEKNGMESLYGIFPITKKEFVLGRYLYTIIMGGIAVLFSCIVHPIVLFILGDKVTWQQIIFTFLYGILLYSIYTVFQLPGYYKYGSINGRMFMYIPIIGFLLVLFGMEKVNLSKNGFAISIFSNLGILAAVITFGIILIYTVSICISIRIMKNKEI